VTGRPVRAMVTAVDALVILLVLLTVTVRLGPAGWLAGIAFAVIGWAVLTEGLRRFDVTSFGPAGRFVLARAVVVGALTALVVETTDPKPDPGKAIVGVAVVAVALSVVSARFARPSSAFETRFAVEVDAFLVLVLSAFVATRLGVWVLAIGVLRYVFVAAGWALPWLRNTLPASRVRTVVGTAQGIVLTVVAAGVGVEVLPAPVAVVLTALSLVALAGSFVQDVQWLRRHRDGAPAARLPAVGRRRIVATVLAFLLVLAALVGPNRLSQLTIEAFARIPVEGLMGVALILVLGARARKVAVAVIGAGLGLLMIVKFLDMGFYEVFDRPFHPVFDWSFLGPAVDFVSSSFGSLGAVVAVVGAIMLVLAIMVLMTLAVRRLTSLAVGHRTAATNALAVLAVLWLVTALSGAQLGEVASRSAADQVYDDARRVQQGLFDGEAFAAQARVDHYRYTPGEDLLTALRGKDVLFVFVESYGRVAIEDSTSAPVIDPILDNATKQLHAAGFDSRSGFLTSPTYGGGSWFAHATLQSGLWVDNQQRYDSLTTMDRMTMSIAFNRAGWRTVGAVPANSEDWPEGGMYHFDKIYDSRNVGYKGPRFSYARVPDQYTLQHFEQTERAPSRSPVMAEIDLVSSHTPYAPLPKMVDWKDVGDGKVYDPMPAAGTQPGDVWPDPTRVRDAYTASIAYSLKSLFSYIETYGDDNMVMVFLGDHQPQPIIASQEDTRDVPISIVARDPAVLDRVSTWGWSPGVNPTPDAPVWPMDKFRDKFLDAYGPQASSSKAAPSHR